MRGVVVAALLGALLLAVVTSLLWLSRVHTLDRRVGSFHCWVASSAAGPWRAGVAQYGSARLYFWSRWSLAPRPRVRWDRSNLSVLERRWQDPDGTSANRLVVATCRSGHDFYLLLSAEAYTGLTSWIEATPSRVNSVT
ncbi:DUF2550 family protein [Cellulomonas sp. URHD0024]|uniref:DUF2550 family protein n=1 Tax=Cellulomonas sp. URHD0024 TaxID=1302620 RepID=UPI0004269457|nr:DUF2550 family protein [Cellulomonas sp. URHD0024]